MPRMDSDNAETPELSLCRALIIGDGKIGKTWWAAKAAAAGFNLLYFDGDVARQTIKSFDAATKKNIWLIPCGDTILGGTRDTRMFETMKEFISNTRFRWNDTKNRLATRKGDEVGDEIWDIQPAKLDHTCVVVLDSWTSLTESITLAAGIANGVDVVEADTPEMRPVYKSAGLKATQFLQTIRSMPCHVIVIGHTDEYSHMTKPDGKKVGSINEKDLVIDWTKLIPKSTSRPQALQMAKYFTDVAWMTTNATGSQRFLDFRISDERLSGGHFTERKDPDKEYTFANLVKEIGGTIPKDAPTDHWLTISTVEAAASVVSPVLDGASVTQPAKVTGMAALMKKPVPAG